MNSRAKGCRGERELRDLFRECGFEAKRGQQHAGGADAPDVIHNIPWLHVECKRVESLNLYGAVEQATRDSGLDRLPVVFHKKNGKRWLAIMDAEWFLKQIKEGRFDG